MIVDSSVLIAILCGESDRDVYLEIFSRGGPCSISAPTALETTIVLRKFGSQLNEDLHRLIELASITILPFGPLELAQAQRAFQRYGRGSGHPAKLNFGDCISYATSIVSGQPLLFKGNDFVHTDVVVAR